MDPDTIFPPFYMGEQIINKYEDVACSTSTRTIIILTNARLLVRWRNRFCGCFHQSTYSAIALGSIYRVDELRMNRRTFLVVCCMLILGLILTIAGFASSNTIGIAIGVIGIFFLVFSCPTFVISCVRTKKKVIKLTGTFGTVSLRLEKSLARPFEAQLSEMIYKIQYRQFEQPKIPAMSTPQPHTLVIRDTEVMTPKYSKDRQPERRTTMKEMDYQDSY